MDHGEAKPSSGAEVQPNRPSWAIVHPALRTALLERIVTVLSSDQRFVALWLTGSVGRGEQDAYSDLDCTAVVSAHAEVLCARPWLKAGHTTPERLALLQCFGTPVLVHEMHTNAPEGGTHMNVHYEDGIGLDLNLVPLTHARRPQETRMLFASVEIPMLPPPVPAPPEQRLEDALELVTLFWIMAMAAAKYRLRGWDVAVQGMLAALRQQVDSVRRLLAGDSPRFQRYATTMPLATTPAAQVATLQALCEDMEILMAELRARLPEAPPAPHEQIARWLDQLS